MKNSRALISSIVLQHQETCERTVDYELRPACGQIFEMCKVPLCLERCQLCEGITPTSTSNVYNDIY